MINRREKDLDRLDPKTEGKFQSEDEQDEEHFYKFDWPNILAKINAPSNDNPISYREFMLSHHYASVRDHARVKAVYTKQSGNKTTLTSTSGTKKISKPGDAVEVEAEQITKQVMAKKNNSSSENATSKPINYQYGSYENQTQTSDGFPLVVRAEDITRKPEENSMMQESGGALETTASFDEQLAAAESGGAALDNFLLARLEQELGVSLGHVRIHTDSAADTLARGVGALAFTSGNHIYFQQGRFAPLSDEGYELLVHELVHAGMQQKNNLILRQGGDGDDIPQQDNSSQWSVKVHTSETIEENDPQKRGMFITVKALYAVIDIDDSQANIIKDKWNWTNGDKFTRKEADTDFYISISTGLYISGLKSIYSNSIHVVDFLNKFQEVLYHPTFEQLQDLAKISQQIGTLSDDEYSIFKIAEDAKILTDTFKDFLDKVRPEFPELIRLSKLSMDEKIVAFHDQIFGSNSHRLKLMVLLDGMNVDQAKEFRDRYSKKYANENGNADILQHISANFGVGDIDVEYELYKRLHALELIQIGGEILSQDAPHIEASPDTHEVAEGYIVNFKFIQGNLIGNDLYYDWSVDWDAEGLTLHELEKRDVVADGLHLANSKASSWAVILFVPGKHRIICRVMDRTPYPSQIKYFSYELTVNSVFQTISKQQKKDVDSQVSASADFMFAQMQLNAIRNVASEGDDNLKLLLTKYNEARSNINNRYLFSLGIPQSSYYQKKPIQDFYDELRKQVEPFDVKHEDIQDHVKVTTYTNPYDITNTVFNLYTSTLNNASSDEEWGYVFENFRGASLAMDKFFAAKLQAKGKNELSTQITQYSQFSNELESLKEKHPDALKVKAAFYPKEYAKDPRSKDLKPDEVLSVPLYLYIYYDEKEKEWVLKDLTQPDKIKTNTKSAEKGSVPHTLLFSQLDSKLRFPEGVLVYNLPDGTIGTVYTHNRKSWADWLSTGAMVVGGIVLAIATAGGSVPFSLVAIGAGLAISASIVNMMELSKQGMLDNTTATIEVLNIVSAAVPVLGMTLGRLYFARTLINQGILTASAIRSWYIVPTAIAIGADLIGFSILTSEAIKDLKQIDASKLSEEEKMFAYARITGSLLLNASMIIVSAKMAKSDMKKMMERGDCIMDIDENGEFYIRQLTKDEQIELNKKNVDEDVESKKNNVESTNTIETQTSQKSIQTILVEVGLSTDQIKSISADAMQNLETAKVNLQNKNMPDAIEFFDRFREQSKNAGITEQQYNNIETSLAHQNNTTSPTIYRNKIATYNEYNGVSHTWHSDVKNAQAHTYGTESEPLYYGSDLGKLANELGLSIDVNSEAGKQTIIEHIFNNGLPSRGTETNLSQHAMHNPNSAFRGTTNYFISPDKTAGAALWAEEGGLVIAIKETPGWDINSTLGDKNPVHGEQEVAILAGVPSTKIIGVIPVNNNYRMGKMIKNPNH